VRLSNFGVVSVHGAFIKQSDGTENNWEHRPVAFVVGAGNANT
jgi:hypothetical protein